MTIIFSRRISRYGDTEILSIVVSGMLNEKKWWNYELNRQVWITNPVGAPFLVESEAWPPKETNVHNIILLQHDFEMTSLTTFKIVPATRQHQAIAWKRSAEIRGVWHKQKFIKVRMRYAILTNFNCQKDFRPRNTKHSVWAFLLLGRFLEVILAR